MKKKQKPNAQQLYAAIRRHDLALLRSLLADGADPNAAVHDDYHGDIPVLLSAAGGQFLEGVKTLLDAGADPNAAMTGGLGGGGAEAALHNAINGSHNRPYDDPKRSTEEHRLMIVDLLLKAGADPNALAQGDALPLYSAARSGYIEICQRLIEAGATFKTWPTGCMPPLTGAVNFGNSPEGQKQERVAELLLNLGAPVDGETATGVTALMTAATGGSENLIKLYLNHGADVNHRSVDGQTPLHCAAVFARNATTDRQRELALRIVKKLVDAGADPNVRNADGESAYDIACRFRISPASEYLRQLSKIGAPDEEHVQQLTEKEGTIRNFLIPRALFTALLESASGGHPSTEQMHTKVWFTLADQILEHWNGVSYSFLDALTPGQQAVVYSAEFYRGAKGQDLLSVVSGSEELPSRTLKAFETLKAKEYLDLLRQIEAVFPGGRFPQYAEDILRAVRKQPRNYFDEVGEKFVTGKGMERPLHQYVFDYIAAHPEDFAA